MFGSGHQVTWAWWHRKHPSEQWLLISNESSVEPASWELCQKPWSSSISHIIASEDLGRTFLCHAIVTRHNGQAAINISAHFTLRKTGRERWVHRYGTVGPQVWHGWSTGMAWLVHRYGMVGPQVWHGCSTGMAWLLHRNGWHGWSIGTWMVNRYLVISPQVWHGWSTGIAWLVHRYVAGPQVHHD